MYLQLLFGAAVGGLSLFVPAFYLSGQVLCFTIGAPALIGHFGVQLVLGAYREIYAPSTTGNPDLLSVAPRLIQANPHSYVWAKVFMFIVGVGVSILMNRVGVGTLPPGLSFALVGGIALFSVKLRGVCLLAGLGLVIQLLGKFGFTNAVIGVVSCIGLQQGETPIEREETSTVDGGLLIAGFVGAIVPGLNPAIITSICGGGYFSALLGNAMSEGISFGVFCFTRSTSKTTLTSFLSQVTRGEAIDGFHLILMLSAVVVVCLCWGWANTGLPQWFLAGGGQCHPFIMFLTNALTVGFFLTQNPFGAWAPIAGLGAAVLVYLLSKVLNHFGRRDERLRALFVSAPLLLGF